jgi:hypothetical protein
MYCNYYQARIKREKIWQLTSVLRSLEHLVFDRTIDAQQSIFEFFVPQDVADDFLSVMHYFEDKGIVSHLQLLPNRLKSEGV